jgi:hypothetical protein
MTTLTATSPKPLTDLELVGEFAAKTRGQGEKTDIRFLWGSSFRVNFWVEERIARSVFVYVSGGKVEIPDKQ